MASSPRNDHQPKVLVTASSKHGATTEIADAIARRLGDRGAEVARLDPDAVDTVDEFDAVILGSAVYAGHWQADASAFAKRFAVQLRERSVWLFSSGPVGDPPRPVDDPVGVDELMADLGARDHRVLPGRIDRGRLGRGERLIVRALKVPDGDARDWDDIADWADQIAAELGCSADLVPTRDDIGA